MIEIFGTLGPACADPETIANMFHMGMNGMRLNLSHGSLKDSRQMLDAFHLAAERTGRKAELLIDMQGPELRIGSVREKEYQKNDPVIFTSDGTAGIPVPDRIIRVLEKGDTVLIDDGKVEALITETGERCAGVIVRGGRIRSRKSIKVIGKDITGPVLTETDLENIAAAQTYGVTALMQPFVTDGRQLKEVRNELEKAGCGYIRVFAKIENRQGIDNLDSIIPEADMIVIARGDLGNDMPLWDLPAAQEYIAGKCRQADTPFMVVTEMLASMVNRPVPTRAEVSDIFRAVVQGASAVMVTNETAVGIYPAEVIRFLKQTAASAENYLSQKASAE